MHFCKKLLFWKIFLQEKFLNFLESIHFYKQKVFDIFIRKYPITHLQVRVIPRVSGWLRYLRIQYRLITDFFNVWNFSYLNSFYKTINCRTLNRKILITWNSAQLRAHNSYTTTTAVVNVHDRKTHLFMEVRFLLGLPPLLCWIRGKFYDPDVWAL